VQARNPHGAQIPIGLRPMPTTLCRATTFVQDVAPRRTTKRLLDYVEGRIVTKNLQNSLFSLP